MPASEHRIHWGSDELPTGQLIVWRATNPPTEVRYVPAAEVERLREENASLDRLLLHTQAGLAEAEAEVERLRGLIAQALDLNRQMYSKDEDNDSPGNLQHAILVHALGG